MIVGLPGAGISGIFYLVCVFLMPFHAVWQLARGRALPSGQWRRIARHWLIGAAMIGVLLAIGWMLGLLTAGAATVPGAPGADGPGAVVSGPSPIEGLATLGAVLTAVTLIGVVGGVQLLSLFVRRGTRRRARVARHAPARA